MKRPVALVVILVLFISTSYGGQRNALVEMFTNSHCPICAGVHTSIRSYLSSNTNARYVRFIHYHIPYPYADDLLYTVNTSDNNNRNSYYDGISATPRLYFDGIAQGSTFSSSSLDSRVNVDSPLEIVLTGSKSGNSFTVNASLRQTGSISATDLRLHFVVVENVTYVGRNGVSPQFYVMRQLVTGANGEPFTITQGESKSISKTISLSGSWTPDSVGIIVFVQSASSKAVFQSEFIPYKSPVVTGIASKEELPASFTLKQNYPNPFNPTTTFAFQVAEPAFVSLKVFDALGREVATVVNGHLMPGQYAFPWDASAFPSGVYLYRFYANGFVETKKTILSK